MNRYTTITTVYLPVEGEIEYPDKVVNRGTGMLWDVTQKDIDDEGKNINKDFSKVKLFGVTDNIELGDEIFDMEGDPSVPRFKADETHVEKNASGKSSYYKVLAQISAAAFWVKEMKVFKKGDWEFCIRDYNDGDWMPVDPEAAWEEEACIRVKCGNCHRYH